MISDDGGAINSKPLIIFDPRISIASSTPASTIALVLSPSFEQQDNSIENL
jgi:hypothetical protein